MPAKIALSCAPNMDATCRRFNPRAREGRDQLQVQAQQQAQVSIHAPVKGATPIV